MLKTYMIESGAGGVGNTFVTRCVVDMLLQLKKYEEPTEIDNIFVIDANPVIHDLCCDTGFKNEKFEGIQIFAIRHPIQKIEDWFSLVDKLDEVGVFNEKNNRVVLSGAPYSFVILRGNSFVIDMLDPLNVVHVWVLGTCQNSVDNLQKNIEEYPKFYSRGIVVQNLKNGPADNFIHWNNSKLEKTLLDWGWQFVDLLVLDHQATKELGPTPFHRALSNEFNSGPQRLLVGTHMSLWMGRGMFTNRFRFIEKM